MKHQGRKPICECENPDAEDWSVGPIELIVCQKCDGVIE